MIRYFTLDNLLYAYDTNSGLTLKYANNQWSLADLTYAYLINDDNVQEIYVKEALKITNNVTPDKLLDTFK